MWHSLSSNLSVYNGVHAMSFMYLKYPCSCIQCVVSLCDQITHCGFITYVYPFLNMLWICLYQIWAIHGFVILKYMIIIWHTCTHIMRINVLLNMQGEFKRATHAYNMYMYLNWIDKSLGYLTNLQLNRSKSWPVDESASVHPPLIY